MRGGPPGRANRVLRSGGPGPSGQGPAPFRGGTAVDGGRGAGTVFFSGCALRCLYCQNYQISQEGLGEEVSTVALADIFLDLQQRGCHNLDLVSPTPHWPFILEALELAIPRGLRLPIVYNTHGYVSLDLLQCLEGVVDIYLPDMKYGTDESARTLSQVSDYTRHNRAAVREMVRQVGRLKTDSEGVAFRRCTGPAPGICREASPEHRRCFRSYWKSPTESLSASCPSIGPATGPRGIQASIDR